MAPAGDAASALASASVREGAAVCNNSLLHLRCCNFGTFPASAKKVSAPSRCIGTTGRTPPTGGMQWAGAPARDPPGRQPRSVGQKIRYNCNDLLRISVQTSLTAPAGKSAGSVDESRGYGGHRRTDDFRGPEPSGADSGPDDASRVQKYRVRYTSSSCVE